MLRLGRIYAYLRAVKALIRSQIDGALAADGGQSDGGGDGIRELRAWPKFASYSVYFAGL
jgi:hypothetical protein